MQTRTEQASSMTINGRAVQVYSYCAQIPANSVVQINAQAEVTTNVSFPVGIAYALTTYDYYVAGTSQYVTSYYTAPPVMQNITADMHHMVISESLADKVVYAGNANTRCYTLSIWAASASGSGAITIEQGYGYLQIVVH